MTYEDITRIEQMILEGYRDLAAGRFFQSTASFKDDLKLAEILFS